MNQKLAPLALNLILVGLLLVGCGTATPLSPTVPQTASASPVPSAAPSDLPSATPTSAPVKSTVTVPAPTLAPTLPPLPQTTASNLCPGTQPSLLMPGRQGRVSAASAATNRVRSEPSTAASIMGEIPAGGYFEVLAGPKCVNGWAWFQVRTDKLEGWMAEGSADEYWVQPILAEAQDVSGPNIKLPGFEFAVPKAVGSKMRVSHRPYDPEIKLPPVSLAQFTDYPLSDANAAIYVYSVEEYLYYRPDQRAALKQIQTAINTLLADPFTQVSLPSVIDSFRMDNVLLTRAGVFKDGFGLHAIARLSPIDGSAEPKPYYVFFGYSSDMKSFIFAKLDVYLNSGQLAQASVTDVIPSLSLLDEIFKLNVPDKCEMAAITNNNLAYQKPVQASASLSAEPPAYAVDGNNSTAWNAGSHAPQWIEIDLGQAYHITEIRLMVGQWPEGDTVHRIQGRSADDDFVHLHTFRQKTSGCDWLRFIPELPIAGIQVIRIDTLSSPSWVAWSEIQVYGETIPSATPTATLIGESSGKIAFVSGRDGNPEIYVMNADGSDPTRLTNNNIWDCCPVGSPDGAKIAFDHDFEGQREIYVMNVDGSGLTNLTNNGGTDYQPAWSPDSTKVAFTSDRDGNYDIYVINADGSDLTNLTNNSGGGDSPAWSPDGTKIAFRSDRAIYLMNADGSNLTRLTRSNSFDHRPVWSSDGTKIAFVHAFMGKEIYVMNADGSDLTNLTNQRGDASDPVWSPDSTKIAFFSPGSPGTGEIYVMNADGSRLTNLTNKSGWDCCPVWSPDGAKVAFESYRDGNKEIYVMNADGSGLTQLTTTGGSGPVWLPTLPEPAAPRPDCTSGWTRLAIGGQAKVYEASATPNRVRAGPSRGNNVIAQLPPGTVVKVLEGPVCTDGLVFWKVDSDLIPDRLGWTAEGDGIEYYLVPYQP